MIILLSVAFFAGCTKKAALKNHTMVHGEQRPMVQEGSAQTGTDDKETRESTLREQELRERELREQTLRDEEVRRRAPERARKESAEKENEAALLKDLQIPDIHFDFDEYNLKPENQAVLKTGARAYLEYTQYKLLIEGHCDERGTVEYNLALGQRRADEAAKYLMDLGIAKERIRAISYGKERPLDPGHDEMALARNRRDHFVVSQSGK